MLSLLIIIHLVALSFAVTPDFSDQLQYDITWHGPLSQQDNEMPGSETVLITTTENEKYQCVLPEALEDGKMKADIPDGPSAEILLSDVLMGDARKCSYRLEPYWTYELCHGQQIVQFHEEKDSDGNVKRSKFVLGSITKEEVQELLSSARPIEIPAKTKRKIPIRWIDNKETPYFSVEMGNGTPCDLSNGKPRRTTVLYICHPTSNNEVMSVKEVTTCEYEMIVLTPALCGNPAYIVKDKPVRDIQCHSFPGSPSLPSKLVEQGMVELKRRGSNQPYPPAAQVRRTDMKPPVDQAINKQFLDGEYCLIGGSGWWQYEFCNGKHLSQFHVEPNQPKIVIKLGYWKKEEHLKFVKAKKIQVKTKKHVVHFYTGGDTCDLNGKPRTARVTLICREASGQQLSIYMTEEEPCKYAVGVESPILCPLVAKADQYGLF